MGEEHEIYRVSILFHHRELSMIFAISNNDKAIFQFRLNLIGGFLLKWRFFKILNQNLIFPTNSKSLGSLNLRYFKNIARSHRFSNLPLLKPEFANPSQIKQSVGTREHLWELMGTYLGRDSRSIQKQIVNHIEYTLGLTRFNFKDFNAYQATAFSVRDRLIEQLNDANEYFDVSKRL